MNRLLILLIGLLVRGVLAQAQIILASNSLNKPGIPTILEAAPLKPKATDSPFYVKVSGFYGLLTPGVQINYSSAVNSGSVPFKTTSPGLGAGPRAGIGVGLIVNDFINIGVDAEVLFGAPITIDYSFEDGLGKSTTTSTTTLKVASVIPNITFKALSRPTFYIYNRLGLVGGLVLDYKKVNSYLDQNKAGVSTSTSGNTSNYTKNSLALGYQAALGIQFRLSQAIRAFAELVAYNQSFKPKTLEYTTTSSTGITTTLLTEYKDQGEEISNRNPQTGKTQTAQAHSYTVPMNSIGLGAGFVLRF